MDNKKLKKTTHKQFLYTFWPIGLLIFTIQFPENIKMSKNVWSITGKPSFFQTKKKQSYALSSTSAKRIPTIRKTRFSLNSKLISAIVQDWKKLRVR